MKRPLRREEALAEGGFEIVIASSGEDAVKMLDASDGKYRALVTDVNFGRDKMDGWEVPERSTRHFPLFI